MVSIFMLLLSRSLNAIGGHRVLDRLEVGIFRILAHCTIDALRWNFLYSAHNSSTSGTYLCATITL